MAAEGNTDKAKDYQAGHSRVTIVTDGKSEEESEARPTKLSVAESVANKLSRQPSMMSRASKISRLRKRREARQKCLGQEPWVYSEDEPLWRIYMKVYADDVEKRGDELAETYGDFYKPSLPKYMPRLLGTCFSKTPICHKLNVHNTAQPCNLTSPAKARIWENMRLPIAEGKTSTTESCTSSEAQKRIYPCASRDPVREAKILARKEKLKLMGALPCEIDEVVSPESSDDEQMLELAALKELGHAVVPLASSTPAVPLVERASGPRPGLVEGEWRLHELGSTRGGNRRLANMVLKGSMGMRPNELDRVRLRTWKFCFYQALVALLAKTQLRYKWAWSATVDYLYERGWLLYLHLGHINTQPMQRFDDVLVYNYKYGIELELIRELADLSAHPEPDTDYVERGYRGTKMRPPPEITLAKAVFGDEHTQDTYRLAVHKGARELEIWLDELDPQYTSCIFRTTRFSLAFWQDGPFWYLYIPYRCDDYGFWNDSGACCIVKFCTRMALKRHLLLFTLRAYARATTHMKEDWMCCPYETEKYTVQIYRVLYHDCRIHNVKLFNRKPRKPKPPLVEKKPSEPCTFDPLAHLAPRICKDSSNDEANETMEKPDWVRKLKITWMSAPKPRSDCSPVLQEPQKWHAFDVVEPQRLYVLWGEAHIQDRLLSEENRGRQCGTCYAVCAAMILIKAPEYWTSKVLDAIIMCGDGFYTYRMQRLGRKPGPPVPGDEDGWEVLPRDELRIGDMLFEVEARPSVHGHLFARGQSLWQALEQLFRGASSFGLLYCESTRIAVFRHCGAYYFLDVRSRGPPIYTDGAAGSYLLRAACFGDLMRCITLLVGSPECSSFELRPLEIVKAVEKSSMCPRKKPESVCPEEAPGSACPITPEDDKKKGAKKKDAKKRPPSGKSGRATTCAALKKTCP